MCSLPARSMQGDLIVDAMRTCPDLARRRIMGVIAALPLLRPGLSGAQPERMSDRGKTPGWAPAAGRIVSIGYTAGKHPRGRGATLAEISPAHQSWNPNAPSLSPYNAGIASYGWHTNYGYCGSSFNTDTRQIVMYGAGHSSINVPAPYCFDLNDLRWKWLDRPLPFDAFKCIRDKGYSHPPTRGQMEGCYPPEQYDYDWGDLDGSWSGWPEGYGRPGKIQPVPTHTRDGMVHLPASVIGNSKGALLFCGAYTGVLANAGNFGGHVFDYDTQTWSRLNQRPPSPLGSPVFDGQTRKVVYFGNGGNTTNIYRVLDVDRRTWITRNASASCFYTTDGGGQLLHKASRLHIVPAHVDANGTSSWGTRDGWIRYRFFATPFDAIVGTGHFACTELTINVASSWPLTSQGNNRYLGWSYCPEDACLYIINGENGSNKYWKLTPPAGAVTHHDYLTGTWTLTVHAFVSGTLSSPGGRPRSMMYNRMQWDVESRSFIWWPDSIDGPVQAWRPLKLSGRDI